MRNALSFPSCLRALVPSCLSSYLLRDPVAGEQIVDRGEQSAEDEKSPGGRRRYVPAEQPRQNQRLNYSVRADQRGPGKVVVELGDASYHKKRRPRHDQDNSQPGNDLSR